MQVQEWIHEMQRAVEIARTIDPPTLDGEPLQLWQIEAQGGGEHVFLALDEDLDRDLRTRLALGAIPWEVHARLVGWPREIQHALERAGISPQVILALWEWRFVVPTREEVAQADDEALSEAMEAAEAAARALGAEAVRFSSWYAGVESWDIEGWLLPPIDLLPLHAANAAATAALREAIQEKGAVVVPEVNPTTQRLVELMPDALLEFDDPDTWLWYLKVVPSETGVEVQREALECDEALAPCALCKCERAVEAWAERIEAEAREKPEFRKALLEWCKGKD